MELILLFLLVELYLLRIWKNNKNKRKKWENYLKRDWCDLPSELLQHIADNLDVCDYIRFRSVCTSWRSSIPDPRETDHPPMPLWLILQFDTVTKRLFYLNSSDGRKHSLTLPELRYLDVTSCYQGWLVIEDCFSLEFFLLNPITRARLPFPPASMLRMEYPYKNKSFCIGSVASDSPPNPKGRNTFVVAFRNVCLLAAFRTGDSHWTILDTNNEMYSDVIYSKEKFFAVSLMGEVLVFSSSLERVTATKYPVLRSWRVGYECWKFAQCSGKLVIARGKRKAYAARTIEVNGHPIRTFLREKVEMWILNPTTYGLEEIDSIGNQILFIGNPRTFPFPVDRFHVRVQEDCVYLPENLNGVYSLKNGEMEELPWQNIEDLCDMNLLTSSWH